MIELREIEHQDIPNVQKYAQKMGIENYYSGCLARNIGSQKALLKNGFSIYDQFLLTGVKYKGEQMLLLHKLCAQ